MHKYASALIALAGLAGCSTERSSPSETEPVRVTVTDASLFSVSKERAGFTPYKRSADTLLRASSSGHSEPLLRTLYNAAAATQLDAAGKVVADAQFPDSSLIVKELINADGTLSRTAVLFKLRTATNADANGWFWAEYGPDGTVHYSVDRKESGCIGCHGSGIDGTLMNAAHP